MESIWPRCAATASSRRCARRDTTTPLESTRNALTGTLPKTTRTGHMKMWPVIASAQEQILALKQALAERDEVLRIEREQREALSKQRDALVGELRITRTERDLLKERLNKFLRKLFEARSESLTHQKEL